VGCVDKESSEGKPTPGVDASSPEDTSDAKDASDGDDTSDAKDTGAPAPTEADTDSSTPVPLQGKRCAPLFSVDSSDSTGAAKGVCDYLPPECDPGLVAELYVVDGSRPDCWTGQCVPAQECDLVDDCRDCGEDTYCKITIDTGNSWRPPEVHPDSESYDGQDQVRVQCRPLSECSDGECDCEEVSCAGSCSPGPLSPQYDNAFTGSLVDHSDGAFICKTYDG
jgi:hypothetical protein